jgi:hypothetical protein
MLLGDLAQRFEHLHWDADGERFRFFLLFHTSILHPSWTYAKRVLPPLPQTRNAPYIPMSAARGFAA